MRVMQLLFLISLLLSLPVSAKICHLTKFTPAKKCSEGDVFGAISKPVNAAVAQKTIANFCDHHASISVIEEDDEPRRYFFSCIYHLNSDSDEPKTFQSNVNN